MAVCCATQLVASTVVCSSEGSALMLFKWRGLWTEYWTDYSRLETAQCIMWGIQQTGEGAVHNGAHKNSKALKYKILLHQSACTF
jgi:hypothetical protein